MQARIRTKQMQEVNDLGVFADWSKDKQIEASNAVVKELEKIIRRK